MITSGETILKEYIKDGKIDIDSSKVKELEELINIHIELCSNNGINMKLSEYISKIKYVYSHNYQHVIIDKHLDYFAENWRNGLSGYKALLYFSFYLEDNTDL